ncbi:MAG: N-acetylmuramoyl-L-alanine amidase [Cyanobacteria bacterium P01_G01_bin.38]
MKWNRLVPGVLGVIGALLLALPAEAARLQSWRFDQRENRLTFSTDTPVQPRAQLIFSPTRLVIDLPGTTLGGPTSDQSAGRGIREVRVGQFDAQTTRIVIELEQGYILDPEQVQVRGETNRDWVVQIPRPQRGDPPDDAPTETTAPAENLISAEPDAAAATQIQGISATADGFFVRTLGEVPEIEVSRSSGRRGRDRKVTIEIENAAIAAGLTSQSLPENRYSVRSWDISQTSDSPPTVEITLDLMDDGPDWNALSSDIGGIVILPDGVSIREVPDGGNFAGAGPAIAISRPNRGSDRSDRSDRPNSSNRRTDERPARDDSTRPDDRPQVPSGRYVVVIDPGHGGRDPGAVGINDLYEKDVVFPISQRVATTLRDQGVEVVLTRTSDYELDLEPRVQIAERSNATVFVSIHANAISLSRPDVNGLETYYTSDEGARFARVVHDIILRNMGMNDRGSRRARFYVIRHTSMPAILIETGFVTGAEDYRNLSSSRWRDRMADSIAQGILTYLEQL